MGRLEVSQLIETAIFLTESCIPIVLLRPGFKAPLSGVDGSWLIVTDPNDVTPIIQRVYKSAAPNLGVVLAPKKDSPLIVVDVDGAEAYEKLKELGVSSSNSIWISKTGRDGWHGFFCWDSHQPPPPRAIRAGKLPVDLLSSGFAVVPRRILLESRRAAGLTAG